MLPAAGRVELSGGWAGGGCWRRVHTSGATHKTLIGTMHVQADGTGRGRIGVVITHLYAQSKS
jgi:hypothetical protein